MDKLNNINWNGLSDLEVSNNQNEFGKNKLKEEKKQPFFKKIIHILLEPMFLLLIVASIIYFVLGEPLDGSIMLIFVIVIISIEIIQEWKTDKTLNALKDLSAPHIEVIRNGAQISILSEDIVPGDLIIIKEGCRIPADGYVIKANDLRINESSLTGESEAVWKKIAQSEINKENKDNYWRDDYCYTGTLVTTGSGTILVDKIGSKTEYGKIGDHLVKENNESTPLRKQTDKLVKVSTIIAGVLFLLVAILTFFDSSNLLIKDRIIQSILSGITLAMAMIPEEFPVVLTIFLSMGAWRLAKKNSLVKKLPAVETMGAVSVLCVDKTGTITMNQMEVTQLFTQNKTDERLTKIMGLACETEPYDPMEIAMLDYCDKNNLSTEKLFDGELITEYPFTDELKMMGHVWHKDNEIIIAAKGSPESILSISKLSSSEKKEIEQQIKSMSREGLRVIAVGSMTLKKESEIPNTIEECQLDLEGLIGLADPPRPGVEKNIEECHRAGIRVVMITGDSAITASSIAKKVGIRNTDNVVVGNQLNDLSDSELREIVQTTNIFSRVTPEHKMRIVKAFKENDEVVAMTGDGVNDAPALKYADIGIAMGKRGSEVSREAADLILMDDNFGTIVNTVKDGRRIYDNIKKAIGYIFVIHIPIALIALAGPFFGISQNALFLLPIHVVLLELVIDPTCSIVLERQPSEYNIMSRPPRKPNESILTSQLLVKSLIQGLVIFAASFGSYYYTLMQDPQNDELARTIGLSVIIFANVFLVLVNSSNTELAIKIFIKMIKDKIMWGVMGATVGILLLLMYSPISGLLDLAPLPVSQLAMVVLLSFLSVTWYDLVKLIKRKKHMNN
ncbi:cation-translocating P-type ATPase [Enterococcus faecalis]|uniref:cation-translocating P-type ATPase n=1 Tax=Enterococcus faecalis TaxID=1351 RepID=UPI002DB6D612|nr:cation-translocating P-type ATPase [Enterococcus faecalis]MEB7954580.1 cation-translocating P-type ATPase [Enterococcus faecalis]MEB7964729.1 cation-translocating P-type ATPase [Enterococcus faecalis]